MPDSSGSAIDGSGLAEDRPAADEIAAALDRLAFHEIDGTPQKAFEFLLQIYECRQIVAGGRVEGDKEIHVASIGIEIAASRRRTENLQPRHPEPAADGGEIVPPLSDAGLHWVSGLPRWFISRGSVTHTSLAAFHSTRIWP